MNITLDSVNVTLNVALNRADVTVDNITLENITLDNGTLYNIIVVVHVYVTLDNVSLNKVTVDNIIPVTTFLGSVVSIHVRDLPPILFIRAGIIYPLLTVCAASRYGKGEGSNIVLSISEGSRHLPHANVLSLLPCTVIPSLVWVLPLSESHPNSIPYPITLFAIGNSSALV